jgi:hypothetical protein
MVVPQYQTAIVDSNFLPPPQINVSNLSLYIGFTGWDFPSALSNNSDNLKPDSRIVQLL